MAKWEVPDDLDARVRKHVDGDVAAYVAQVVSDQLDLEDDPDVHAELLVRTQRGLADAKAGKVRDAHEAMNELAKKHSLVPPG
ncbi:MAG: hypothetical protein GC164_08560 [Phycisphaera sp.]|nr:hypothetical protein [Phycisphaera sp.]